MGGVSMEWKEVRLGDVCEIKHGFAYKGKYFSDTPTCDILVTPGNFTLSGGFKLDKPKFYNGPVEKDYILSKGDLIVTMTDLSKNIDTLGYSALVPEVKGLTFHHNQRIGLVENIANNVDKYFLYWIMRTPAYQSFIATHSSGTTVHHTSPKGIGNYIFKLPPLYDQRRIASILSSLDRKIELNNKINADLEEMAQAIFKNWFVDFEPFKDGKFVDSELGMIPEGWKVVVFDNILNVTTTKTGKEGIPEYSVTNTGIHPRDEKFTKNLSKSSAKNKLIRKGNLVFGMSREILNWGIMKEEVGGVSSAYNVYIVDEKIVNTTYLECFIAQRMDYFADLIKPASREGQGVDKALLMKKIICIPPSEVMDVFLEKYNSIMHLTEIRNQENSRLSLLRDTLLPRLMSGELEVPE